MSHLWFYPTTGMTTLYLLIPESLYARITRVSLSCIGSGQDFLIHGLPKLESNKYTRTQPGVAEISYCLGFRVKGLSIG